MMFRIYPAVDIRQGKCVRLYQGDFERETVYSDRPWEIAGMWEAQGASYIHVVDLDGAASGEPVNTGPIESLLKAVDIPVQVGGGIRREEDIELVLKVGAARAILGTRAVEDPDFIRRALEQFGDKVIVSLDTREGRISVRGWSKDIDRPLEDVLEDIEAAGAGTVIHTDITRDGTLRGYDTSVLEPLLERGLGVIAAGGIGSREDLESLKELSLRGLEGAVVGRALYTGELRLSEALKLEED